MNSKKILLWVLQIIPAYIFLQAAWMKFTAASGVVSAFTILGMEPGGRILIGVLELVAAVLLLIPAFAASGALLGFGIMLGAVIAHATRLGMAQSGFALSLICIALICTGMVIYLRRKQLPLLGETM